MVVFSFIAYQDQEEINDTYLKVLPSLEHDEFQ
jgi:hypothetical protein